jgi:DNA-binding NarL/FixJ family response regulator
MSEKIRIMIVDDHYIALMGVSAILNTVPDLSVVAEAENTTQALELYRQHKPDITLMDLRLPGSSGIEALTAIKKEYPQARVIMLTNYDGDEDIYRALQAGARGYLLKGVRSEELIDAIRTVHSGHISVPSEVAVRLAQRLPGTDLSSRELEVLKLVASGKSNKEIGAMLSITERTVKAHVNSILAKMDVRDRTQAATTAIQKGIIHLY